MKFAMICCWFVAVLCADAMAATEVPHVTTKMLATTFNLIGLLLITAGGIGAANAAPAPKYGADGSVAMSGEPDKEKRIAMHRRQKYFGHFLWAVAVGAMFQAVALFVG